jgi:hypothetical protein
MRRIRIAALVASLLCSTSVARADSTFEAAVRGASCKQNVEGQLNCTYRIGKDLELGIAAVGTVDAGISFLRSDIAGDYYARFGLQHGCIIVAPGAASKDSPPPGYAFVSPQNGKVYRTWQECKTSR